MATQILSQQDIVEEFYKCGEDIVYFICNYIKVPVAGTGTYAPMQLWEPQYRFPNALKSMWEKKDKNGVVLLASRQCGKTQMVEATVLWLMLFHPNYVVLHLNRDLSQGKQSIVEIKDMIDNLPDWLKPKFLVDNKQEGFKFLNGSQFILQASNKTKDKKSSKGRGRRPTFIWVDEAAFMPLEEHMASILPAVSRTFLNAKKYNVPYGIVFTSTPNGRTGMGEGFYKTYTTARDNPKSSYEAVTIYWHECPGYDQKWFAERCADEHCTIEVPNQKVQQEYNLMFVGSDASIFPEKTMTSLQDPKSAMDPIYEQLFVDGYLRWWDMPDATKRYICGLDTGTSVGTDYSTMYIRCFETRKQICELKVKCLVERFGEYASNVLKLLPKKVIVFERNGVGNHLMEIMQKNFPLNTLRDTRKLKDGQSFYDLPLGLHLDPATRIMVFDQIFRAVNEEPDMIMSFNTRFELSSLERKSGGKIEGNPNDDLCISMGYTYFAEQYFDLTPYFGATGGDMSVPDSSFDIGGGTKGDILGDELSNSFVLDSFFGRAHMENIKEYAMQSRNKYGRRTSEDELFDSI